MTEKVKDALAWERNTDSDDGKYQYHVEVRVSVPAVEQDELNQWQPGGHVVHQGSVGRVTFSSWQKGPRGGVSGSALGPSFSEEEWTEINSRISQLKKVGVVQCANGHPAYDGLCTVISCEHYIMKPGREFNYESTRPGGKGQPQSE